MMNPAKVLLLLLEVSLCLSDSDSSLGRPKNGICGLISESRYRWSTFIELLCPF